MGEVCGKGARLQSCNRFTQQSKLDGGEATHTVASTRPIGQDGVDVYNQQDRSPTVIACTVRSAVISVLVLDYYLVTAGN